MADHSKLKSSSLIVFGAGYVGSAIVRMGIANGMKVTALTRNSEICASLREIGATAVCADLATDTWHAGLPRADYVINCVSSGGGGPEAYQRSYVEGTQSTEAWLRRVGGCDTYLYTSSTSVYPQQSGVVDENASTEGAADTARILLEAEATVRHLEKSGGCRRSFVLRLAGIYGPERHHLLDQLRRGETVFPGKGDHRLNLIHRDDIITAVFAALSSEVGGGIFNVTDDAPSPKLAVTDWLADRLGVKRPSFSGIPVPGRRSIVPDREVSNAKIRAVLGWAPRYPDFRRGYESLLGA